MLAESSTADKDARFCQQKFLLAENSSNQSWSHLTRQRSPIQYTWSDDFPVCVIALVNKIEIGKANIYITVPLSDEFSCKRLWNIIRVARGLEWFYFSVRFFFKREQKFMNTFFTHLSVYPIPLMFVFMIYDSHSQFDTHPDKKIKKMSAWVRSTTQCILNNKDTMEMQNVEISILKFRDPHNLHSGIHFQ